MSPVSVFPSGNKRGGGTSGFALVLTLVLIVGLAALVVAFLASVRSETAATHAFSNAVRARQTVDGALAVAMAQLRSAHEQWPDAATCWEPLSDADGNRLTEGTLLHFRTPALTGERRLLPLLSGGVAVPLGQKARALTRPHPDRPFADPDNSVDLNRARFMGDATGWLGSPPGAAGRRVIRVPWVELTDPEGRVTARYAFWIEDESFKLPLNRLGTGPLGEGLAPEELPMRGLLALLGGPADPSGPGPGPDVEAVVRLRDRWYPLPDHGLLARLPSFASGTSGSPVEAARFYSSLHSGALNLSRAGTRRLNVNTLFTAPDADPRTRLDRFIAPIARQLPRFGERFYRLNTDRNAAQVSGAHQRIYLEKIAANLCDALDADSQPTVILADGTLAGAPARAIVPESGLAGENPVIAVGKEAIPYLQEYACRVRLTRFDPPRKSAGVTSASYDFYLDYYFEFWNMSPRDITAASLGPHPYLRVENQPGFDTGTGGTPIPAGRAFTLPLPADLVFPAGRVTVLTTDPSPSPALVADASRVVSLAAADSVRRYRGTTTKVASNGFRVDLIPRSSARTDHETVVILGNDLGLIETFGALPLIRGDSTGSNALSIHNDDTLSSERLLPDTIANHHLYFMRGGSLRGNRLNPGATQYGDPRTNNEQLFLRLYDAGGDIEQTRFYNSDLGNAQVPAGSSLGLPNRNYVDPEAWPEPFVWSENGVDAPMTVPDGPLRSIGELGHLFDPAREPGPSGDIRYSRGGGRTLAIGRPDPLWDGDPDSASRQWTAWRLTDLFAVTDEVVLPGRINPNGLRRDGGAVFRALFHGDPSYPPEAIEATIALLLQRLESRGFPLEERGELSQWLTPLLPASGDRKEAFRRLVELTATRGNVFTLYALGQVIAETPAGEKRVRATARTRLTVELLPEWTPPLDDAFDPASPEAVAARLRPPDRYRVRVLRAAP